MSKKGVINGYVEWIITRFWVCCNDKLRRNRYVINIMYCVRLDVYGLHYPLNNFYVM
jgi:hypothetical protein